MSINNKLLQLKQFSTVVADTGDIESIKRFMPVDATTNPSLLYKASLLTQYTPLLDEAKRSALIDPIYSAPDRFACLIGKEILSIISGRVSTEVDARLSFNTQETIKKAFHLIQLYEKLGVDRSRILIKIASTWQGIAAAKQLQKEGINCNLTLLFNFEQAQACADAGVFLISPFVGRILDWHQQNMNFTSLDPLDDPGVASVRRVFNYYKENSYNTIIMGASFRNTGQIEALSGCDYLTISPALLEELERDHEELIPSLNPSREQTSKPSTSINEDAFLWAMNEDIMAQEKLSEGIRNFAKDQDKLEEQLL
jgi:transaldolase